MIDAQATREKLRDSGRTITGWARARNFDPSKMPPKFYGRVNFTGEEVEALRTDGLLVEMEEKKHAA